MVFLRNLSGIRTLKGFVLEIPVQSSQGGPTLSQGGPTLHRSFNLRTPSFSLPMWSNSLILLITSSF
jgi:hypothetical protein